MGTGVLRLLGRGVENRYVRRGPTSYSVIGEAMFRPQSASEHAIPTSRQNLLQIQYLNLVSGWCALGFKGHVYGYERRRHSLGTN